MSSNCELLLEDLESGDPLRGNVEEIARAATRAASLTRQLLAVGRRQVLQPTVLDPNDLIVGIERLLRGQLGGAIDFEIVQEPALGRTRVDKAQIEGVLLNLVTNARDAMPEGGRLRITTANIHLSEDVAAKHPGARAGKYVAIIVADTGHGMDEDTLPHVFEPFFTTKEMDEGIGLGLASVAGIVRQSGGFITMSSTVGQGTTVRIFLPQVEAASNQAAPGPRPPTPAARSETALVIDDDTAVLGVTCKLLRKLGYDVLEADNPGRAVELVRDHPGRIDLVLSDIALGRTRGPVLVKELLALRPDLRVVFMSGFAPEAIAAEGGLSAQAGFIKKPFSLSELRAMLDRAIG